MGGDPVWVPQEQRVLYHAALAFGSNYLITLVAQATVEAVVAAAELLNIGPLLDHRAPTDKRADEKHGGDRQTGRIHLTEVPDGALVGLGRQQDRENGEKHRR